MSHDKQTSVTSEETWPNVLLLQNNISLRHLHHPSIIHHPIFDTRSRKSWVYVYWFNSSADGLSPYFSLTSSSTLWTPRFMLPRRSIRTLEKKGVYPIKWQQNNNIRPETDVTGERKKEEKKGGENSIYQKLKRKPNLTLFKCHE